MPVKKKGLPFKTAPKKEIKLVGDELSGVLEVPVFGDVTVREQAWISEQQGSSSTFRETARIANKISKAEKDYLPLAAHSLVSRCITAALAGEADFSEAEQSLRIKYAREIDDLCKILLETQWNKQLITVAAIIRFRIKGQEEFSKEDAAELPQQLVTDIYALAMLEMNRATFESLEEATEAELEEEKKALEQSEKDLEEDLKK